MIGWLVQTMVASVLLMGVVLAVRAPVRRLFGARAAYALWALPAIRMVLPPLPGWRALFVPVAIFRPHEAHLGLMNPIDAVRMDGGQLAAFDPLDPAPLLDPLPSPALHLPEIALAVWLGVAALWLAVSLWRYRSFLSEALARAVPLATECGVDVLASPAVPGPMATGVFRRRILLPSDFLTRYTSEERRLALLHEGAHHDRRDLAANLVALAVRSLHWWNPLAIVAHRAFRADQELACDATVLADGRNSRAAYAHALMKSAVGRTPAMACAMDAKTALRQRIATMARAPIGRVRLVAGAVLALAAIVAGTVATASGRSSAPMAAEVAEQPALLPPAFVEAPVVRFHGASVVRPESASEEASRQADVLAQRADAMAREADRQGQAAERQSRVAERDAALAERDAERRSHAAERDAMRAERDGERQARAAERAAEQAERQGAVAEQRAAAAVARARPGIACAPPAAPTAGAFAIAPPVPCRRETALALPALMRARASVAAARGLDQAGREEALAGIDAAIAQATR